jgi:leucyl aminopeptidase
MQARLVNTRPEAVQADALIVLLLEGENTLPAEVAAVDKQLGGAIQEIIRGRQFTGKHMDQVYLRNLGKLPTTWTLLVGLGKADALDPVRVRNAVQAGARYLRKKGNVRIAVVAPSLAVQRWGGAEVARTLTEGAALGNFEQRALRTRSDEPQVDLADIMIVGVDGDGAVAGAVDAGLALASATNQVREWVNLPANSFTPTVFVQKVRDFTEGKGLDLQVLEVEDMRRLQMGALLAVAKGSDEPAKFIVLRYGGGKPGGPTLALVGKGITFDSGGISLKPADHMEYMKGDMGGGAAVVGAMRAIAELKPAINVIGVVPTTENMPSGKATRPGDVVTASNGKTIEVINTDAEGRLILADGLTYAVKEGATHIVDVATLTGSIARSLGPVAMGAFTNNTHLMDLVRKAADLAGERVWEMPTWADYDGLIDSDIADIKNSTVPWAGATTAALFLREFVDGRPWVHLDIAGTAWQDASELKAIPKGPTGSAVRLLAHLAQLLASEKA